MAEKKVDKKKQEPSKVKKEEKTSSKVKEVVQKTVKTVHKPVIRPKTKKQPAPKNFEDKADLEKIYLYTIVVGISVGKSVEKLLQELGSSIQFVHIGKGTASKEVLNILGITDDTKAIVNAIVSEDHLKEVEQELAAFFLASKKNRGVAFAIPFSSLVGVRMYKYLTQTL